jgi:hypothetical protein
LTIAPRPRSTAADLLRVLACWLAALLLLQGVAAAQALGRGPLHRHDGDAASHAHHHATGERHHHLGDAADASVTALAEMDDADRASLALTAALALMVLGHATACLADRRRHVWRQAPSWSGYTHLPAPPRRPPRPC